MMIAPLLKQMEVALRDMHFESWPAELYDPVRYTMANGGKRMRPLLVLMGCKLFKDDVTDAMGPAMAVELFHNFSLLHDDLMDNAPVRRGHPSVHVKWNPNIAILSGDAMLVLAYQALARTDAKLLPELLDIFSSTALKVCEGQQLDMNFEQRNDVAVVEYEQMIALKTAVLLAASLKMGAIIGGADAAQAKHLYDFGLHAGIAFQLQDDILDVFGDSGKVGKQQGGDIVSDKKTYLQIKALQLATGPDRKELALWKGNGHASAAEKVRAVTDIYHRLGIRELAEERMSYYHDEALRHLEPVMGNEEWKATLRKFTDSLMIREY
ncbi:MAG: polyprenyl synthetase family protein [Flavobacteriales bacterium]|nr:polyprenyl synthetase family protein [Flavobacteriales bacterium]